MDNRLIDIDVFARAWSRIKTYLSNHFYNKSEIDNKFDGIIDESKSYTDESLKEAKEYADSVADAARQAGIQDLEEAKTRINQLLEELRSSITRTEEYFNQKISETRQAAIDDLETAKTRINELITELREKLSNIEETFNVKIDEANQRIDVSAGHIDELTGKVSSMQVTLDNIHQIVGLELASILADPEGEAVKAIKLIIDNETSHITTTVFENVMREVDGRYVTNSRFSEVTQDLEGIHATVASIESDVSETKEKVGTLELTAEHFDTRITTNEGKVGELEVKSGEIDLIVSELQEGGNYAAIVAKINEDSSSEIMLKADKISMFAEKVSIELGKILQDPEGEAVKAIRLIIDQESGKITTTVYEHVMEQIDGRYATVAKLSEVTQDLEGLHVTVAEIQESETETVKKVHTLEVTVGTFDSRITELGNSVSEIKQTSDEISLTVAGLQEGSNYASIVAKLNADQTSTISISANKIALLGETIAEVIKSAEIYADNLYVKAAHVTGKLSASQVDLTGLRIDYNQIDNPPVIPSEDTIDRFIKNYLDTHPIEAGDEITITDYTNDGRQYQGRTTQIDSSLSNGIIKRVISVKHNGTTTNNVEYFADTDSGYLLTNVGKGTDVDGSLGFFKVSTQGLLKARNAIIYGSVYANTGYFGNLYVNGSKVIAGGTDYTQSNSYFDENGILHCKGIVISGGNITWGSISDASTNVNNLVNNNTKVTNAANDASAAKTTANNAQSTANSALSKANDAEDSAGEAYALAEDASDSAYDAYIKATGAKSTADTANTKATQAANDASTALENANEALEEVSKKDNAWVTEISENYIKTSSVVAQYLQVNAAKILGTLKANQIDATSLHVNAANVDGVLSASQIDVDSITINAAKITGKLSASQIDVDSITIKAANVTGILEASQIRTDAIYINASHIIGKLSAGSIDTESIVISSVSTENSYGSVSISSGTISMADSSGNPRLKISGEEIDSSGGDSITGSYSMDKNMNVVTLYSTYTSLNENITSTQVSFQPTKTGILTVTIPQIRLVVSKSSSSGSFSGVASLQIRLYEPGSSTPTIIFSPSGKSISFSGTGNQCTIDFESGSRTLNVGSGKYKLDINISVNGGGQNATISANGKTTSAGSYEVAFGSQFTQIGRNGFLMMSNSSDKVEFITKSTGGSYSIRTSNRGIKVENGYLKFMIGTNVYAITGVNSSGYVTASASSW